MNDVRFSVLDQLDQLEEVVLEGSRLPFTGGRLVNETDAVELLDAVRDELPKELERAVKLLDRRDEFINTARRNAEEIVEQAQRQHEQLVNNAAIRQEAERQVNEMREQARQQCEQLLQKTRQQGATLELEMQGKLAQLEQQFASRRQQLEQERWLAEATQTLAKAVEEAAQQKSNAASGAQEHRAHVAVDSEDMQELQQLMELGFPRVASQSALVASHGSVEQAADIPDVAVHPVCRPHHQRFPHIPLGPWSNAGPLVSSLLH